jgi:hypothetical protein
MFPSPKILLVMVLLMKLDQPLGMQLKPQQLLRCHNLALSHRSLVPELLLQELPMQTKAILMVHSVLPLVQPMPLVLLPLTTIPLLQVQSACSWPKLDQKSSTSIHKSMEAQEES